MEYGSILTETVIDLMNDKLKDLASYID